MANAVVNIAGSHLDFTLSNDKAELRRMQPNKPHASIQMLNINSSKSTDRFEDARKQVEQMAEQWRRNFTLISAISASGIMHLEFYKQQIHCSIVS